MMTTNQTGCVKAAVAAAILVSGITTAQAGGVFYPVAGVVCDRISHFCADRQGISMALTTDYLGKSARITLQKILGDGVNVHLDSYTLSNGVFCESQTQRCYSDRFKTREAPRATMNLFGKQPDGVK